MNGLTDLIYEGNYDRVKDYLSDLNKR